MLPGALLRVPTLAAPVLLGAMLLPVLGAHAASPAGQPAVASAAESESAVAARTGQRVPVETHTTETSLTWANPDGSFTTDLSAQPVRVRRGSGWTPVDTDLVVAADGRVRPRAAAVSIALSNGGPGAALASVAKERKVFTLGWATSLPQPILAANVATYPEVLPGVDLQISVEALGFSEVLVVKTPEAATNAALKSVQFTTAVVGGTTTKTGDGGLRVVDASGTEVFAVPQPLMWDSSETATSPARTSQARQQNPGDASHVRQVPMGIGPDTLTLTPDETFLKASSTRYPVMIDPGVWYTAARSAHAMVNASYPTQPAFNWSSAAEGMGHTTSEGTHKKRLFYMFRTNAINAKVVRAATFKAFETWSHSCTPSTVQAWETGAIYSSTTWNSQPTWKAHLDSATVAVGRDGCTPGGQWVSFDVLAAVQRSQSAGGYNTTLGLKASSESGELGWKRFRKDAILSIEYNSKPATPTSVKTTYPSTSCVTGAARPALPRVDPPVLNATIRDADGVKGQTVQGKFEVWNVAHTSMVHSFYTPFKLPGGVYTDTVPALPDGSYAWRVFGYDNMNYSPWSQWCEFTVDGTRPAQPTLSTVPTTGYCTADAAVGDTNDAATCGVGETSKFRVRPPDSGVTRYRWSVNSTTPTSAFVAISAPDFVVPHRSFGPETVRVWTYDAAGNISTGPGELEYRVRGAGRSGWWRMDDTGSTLADASGRNRPMTLTGGYTRVPGRYAPPVGGDPSDVFDPTDYAVRLNGSTGKGSTAGPVLAMGSAYTMSAWVRLDTAPTARGIIASQDRGPGPTAPWSAVLFVDPPSTASPSDPESCACPGGRVEFAAYDGTKTASHVFADRTLVPGEWAHVVGVYSPGEPSMQLYLDGELVGSRGDAATANQTTATPTGPFRVGHLTGYSTGWFPGVVDEVGTFDGAYDEDQAQKLHDTVRPTPAP